MRRSERFIQREPYFFILADPRYLSANRTAEAEREFFRSGEKDVAEIYDIARQRVMVAFMPRRVLEYGCGIGRLAVPLAQRAERVTAVDASPAMLAAAKTASNIDYIDDDQFRVSTATFDLITCFLVLQRLRRDEGLALLSELLARLDDGGVLVAQVPFHRPSRPLESLRRRVPGVNALANLARGKPLDTPLIPTTTYDVDEIAAMVRAAGCGDPYLVFTKHGDADAVVLYARKLPQRKSEDAPRDETFIDVKELVARSSIDDLNRTAEAYFASLTEWDHHLAKPFSRADEAPAMLINLAVLLQGLRLSPGDVVLDFGGGTGWLSRFLTQLGCRAIVLDVSATALDIARALYDRMPVAGNQPAPRFVQFDGHRIDLPDASVDRVVCFDAFHHAPNPAEVIREFARILKPGGIAGFAEPGPRHSQTPQSQFEMRTYGVVEADIDIQWLRDVALDAGFAEMKVAALNIPPFHLTVEQYDDLLDGGPTAARWEEWSRAFMRDVRDFFLIKRGEMALDSRHGDALACTIEARLVDSTHVHVTVRNAGRALWLPSGVEPGAVNLGCHLYDADGKLIRFDHAWADLTPDKRAVAPGETVETTMALPPLDPGRYEIEIDLVATRVGWFAQLGSKPARLEIAVPPSS
ncbi:MAG: methyltransferase domain-containing protein [Acidobacteriota bacterium]